LRISRTVAGTCERAFDQVAETLAVAFPLAEAVDDEKVGTGLERLGDTGARVLKPCEVEPAAARASVEILRRRRR